MAQALKYMVNYEKNPQLFYSKQKYWYQLKSIHQNEECQSRVTEVLRGTGGPRRKVWTRTKILSPNMRYLVAN